MSNYLSISKIGSNLNSQSDNPLTYCMMDNIENGFLHGSGAPVKNGNNCQLFMSEYCSTEWDSFCEVASIDTKRNVSNTVGACMGHSNSTYNRLKAGEILIKNTASRKYLVKMIGSKKIYRPFDPNVASSPLISYWVPDMSCSISHGVPVYSVNPKTIDNDIVMNKILLKPYIAFDILINIYNSMKRFGTLDGLKDTKIGRFFVSDYFKGNSIKLQNR